MSPFFETSVHRQIRDTARRFVEQELVPEVDGWETDGIPGGIFARLGAAGLLGAHFPEDVGGAGGDLLSALPVVEEISLCRNGGFVTSYLVQAHIATPIIDLLGTTNQRQEFLRPAVAGERIGCLAVTEPDAGSDVSSMRTRARRSGGDWILDGTKMYITNGGIADFAVVAAKTGDGPRHRSISLFLVDSRQKGFQASPPLRKLGLHSSNTVGLTLESVTVPASHLLGDEGEGFRYIMEGFQQERLVSSVYAYASAIQAIEDAVDYLDARTAFGAPLSDRQAIRHTLSQLRAEIEAARQLCYATAWRMNAGEDVSGEVSMCKLLTAETANRVAYQVMQFHGGYGYMEESGIARYYRDVRLYSIGGGASEIMREIVARQLFNKGAATKPSRESKLNVNA